MKNSKLPKFFALVAMVCSSLFALAQNNIVIEPFTINPGQTKEIDVILNNDEALLNMQFDIVMPSGLSIVKDEDGLYFQPTDRIDLETHMWLNSMPQSNTYRLICANKTLSAAIGGESGKPVATFTVKAAANAFNYGEVLTVNVNNISFTSVNDPYSDIYATDYSLNITKNKPVVLLSVAPQEVNVESYTEIPVTVALQNEKECYSMQFDVTLPEGMAFDSYTKCDRIGKTAEIYFNSKDNKTRFIITNFAAPAVKGNEGDVLVLNFKANGSLDVESVMTFSDIVMTDETGVAYYGNTDAAGNFVKDFSIKVVNSAVGAIQEKYDADVERMNEIAQAYQEFVNDVNENYPGYAALKAEEIVQLYSTIEDINKQITDALEASYDTGIYDGPATGDITAAYEALINLITGCAENDVAIDEAVQADVDALDEAYSKIESLIEGGSDTAKILGTYIDSLKDKVAEAEKEAKGVTGEYVSPLTQEVMDSLDKAIEELLGTTGIDDIMAGSSLTRYYDINGVEVVNPVAGKLYIKVTNGASSKVIK